jgi:hypothetical protein
MLRLLLRLFGIKDFEVCASCETLKQQLDLANDEKNRLTETLLRLVKPEVIQQNPVLIPRMADSPAGKTFAARRNALEQMHARKEEVVKHSPFVAKPDNDATTNRPNVTGLMTTEEVESKLGIGNV